MIKHTTDRRLPRNLGASSTSQKHFAEEEKDLMPCCNDADKEKASTHENNHDEIEALAKRLLP